MKKISVRTNLDVNQKVLLSYLADRIRLTRKIRHLTIASMASDLGVTRKQFQNYESGQTNISIFRLWQIAQLLGVDLSFLIDGFNKKAKYLDNDELDLIKTYNNIKDKNVKLSIMKLLKEI